MNHWLPHFEIKSGEDVDDAVERVHMHVWAYRANRSIKATNKKKIAEGNNDLLEEKCFSDAPEGTTGNVMLELPILKKYWEHPYLQVNTRENGDENEMNGINEEGTAYSSVTSLLKSRKQQRKKKDFANKKTKTAGELDHFRMQAAAANRKIAAEENKNVIAFLRLIQESNVYSSDELEEKFKVAEKKILDSNESTPRNISIDSDETNDDDNEIDI